MGSHSNYHIMVNRQDPVSFREDLSRSCRTIEDIIGKKVVSYRSPSWSIGRGNLWALEILQEEGILFDSSLQPFKTFLSGESRFPAKPFHPIISGRELDLLEIPPVVHNLFGIKIPFSGGTYFRIIPFGLVKYFFRKATDKKFSMIYVHPWEFDPEQPRLKTSLVYRIAHYYKLNSTEKRFKNILDEFSFCPLQEYMKGKEFPHIVLE